MTDQRHDVNSNNNNNDATINKKNVPAGAASLMNLFEPPAHKDEQNGPSSSNATTTAPTTSTTGPQPPLATRKNQTLPPPPPPPPPMSRPPLPPVDLERQSTARRSNLSSSSSSSSEKTSLLSVQEMWLKSQAMVSAMDKTPKTAGGSSKYEGYHATTTDAMTNQIMHQRRRSSVDVVPLLSSIRETSAPKETTASRIRGFCREVLCSPTTLIGSVMMLLYHVVFCLAMGSSITKSGQSVLGIMTKMTSVGILCSCPLVTWRLVDIPALYATTDLFLAPFFAHLAQIVDTAVANVDNDHDNDDDTVFFATFSLLVSMALVASGTLLVLASKFQLANLGTFLPYSVLCGFFSAVGIMLLQLAFTVDTNGQTWASAFFSVNDNNIWASLKHHLPSLVVGMTMKWLGPKNPFWISVLVLCTILSFYICMLVTGTSLQQAQEEEWFWSKQDLVYHSRTVHFGFDKWAPPAPFGVWNTVSNGKVHWGAVQEGIPIVCALSFLYTLRCSLHATALKKNIRNLIRYVPKEKSSTQKPNLLRGISDGIKRTMKSPMMLRKGGAGHVRKFSEKVDIEFMSQPLEDGTINGANGKQANNNEEESMEVIRAKNTKKSLPEILMEYSWSQYLVALVGGFCTVPCTAISPTMYSLGAEGVAPQYGSVLLLLVFYLTNFELVGYIPKAAFSSLLVLSALDMLITWFIKSFHRTREKTEWLVVPLIVGFAFVVGLLNAVFLGVAISTFIFVASFFQTSVVKYAATGLSIRSTIERHITSANWLDQNGDLIQVLVIQNYLFFGNASSLLSYIGTMFEEPDSSETEKLDFDLPPTPKFLILDMTLITGMDTSTVDVVSDIKALCANNGCKLFMAGLSSRLRSVLALGGVQQERGERSKRQLRMFPDLDSAIGKAEDALIQQQSKLNDHHHSNQHRARVLSEGDNGFRYALRQVDEQHGTNFALGLVPLHKFTHVVELKGGEPLFDSDGKPLQVRERGLFFIESGMMKTERDFSQTLSRGNSNSLKRRMSRLELSQMNARTGSIGRQNAALKAGLHDTASRNMRLSRIGPGWVVGTIEGVTGLAHTGSHVALTDCRLHHLGYSKIQEIESENPVLVLRLYKMLAHLMARRQEVTIEHLATLHSIMTSPAHTRPLSRATQGALASVQNS